MENYRALYKVPAKSGKLRGEKRETARREQKKKREDTFLERRNIPNLEEESSSVQVTTETDSKHGTRREKLLRWKAEKEKLIAAQKLEKKRPPFKVGVAHHAICPSFELIASTRPKCTTSKKVAAESRREAVAERRNKQPTEAASSLAALSAPVTSAAFSGRVTRSRTAATAAAKPIVQAKSKSTQQRVASLASSTKTSSVSASASFKGKVATGAGNSKHVKVGSSKAGKKELEVSFAPKDHKFKAPASLTLPTTPLALKRSAPGFKAADWPHIPGVGVLSPSTLEPSPKIRKTEVSAAQRRGRLSRAVKEKTLAKSPKVEKTLKKTPKAEKTLKKTPKAEKIESPTVEKTSDAESEPARKMSRSNRRSSMFIVADMPESPSFTDCGMVVSPTIDDKSNNIVEPTVTSSAGRSKRSMSSKKRQSIREKENIPAEKKEDPSLEETVPPSIQELPVIANTRRMSIHEPSPAVNVSPDQLTNGMVPAQFSPFVTSARGKDKYSLHKRRSSLIPVVPEVSAEELAKSQQIDHFRNLLERESSRLLTLSALWEERKGEAPPVVQDKILGPIGQARLLVNDKFQQFRRLVDKFESGDTEGKMTADDLTGFWEMVLLTVDNVDKRFKELEDLKENNWQEQITQAPAKKTVPSAAAAASKPAKARSQAQSRLKDIIEAARKRKQEAKQNMSNNVSSNATTFDGGFFKVESPKKVLPSPKNTSGSPARSFKAGKPSTPLQFHRRSLLQQVLTNSAVRARNSPASSPLNTSLPVSPSPKAVSAQMRASELGRRMSMDSGKETFSADAASPVLKPEPTKSILKSARRSLKINTPRNRVAFEMLNRSENSSPGSPVLFSPNATPPNGTPSSQRTATPGNRRRHSLIPRLIPTPKTGERVSLLPVRESLIPSKPLPNGDLIDFDSPRRGSRS